MGTPVSASTAQCTQVVALAEPQPRASSSSCVPGVSPQCAHSGLSWHWGTRRKAVRMSASQVSSFGRWTRTTNRRKAGMQAGDRPEWLWLGRAWRGWATKKETVSKIRGRRLPSLPHCRRPQGWPLLQYGAAEGAGARNGAGDGGRAQVGRSTDLSCSSFSRFACLRSSSWRHRGLPDSPRGSGSVSAVETSNPCRHNSGSCPVQLASASCTGPGVATGFDSAVWPAGLNLHLPGDGCPGHLGCFQSFAS